MPIYIPVYYNDFVYSKSDIDEMIINILEVKADKVSGAVEDNLASLTGLEGNLLDSGSKLSDLLDFDIADGETFTD